MLTGQRDLWLLPRHLHLLLQMAQPVLLIILETMISPQKEEELQKKTTNLMLDERARQQKKSGRHPTSTNEEELSDETHHRLPLPTQTTIAYDENNTGLEAGVGLGPCHALGEDGHDTGQEVVLTLRETAREAFLLNTIVYHDIGRAPGREAIQESEAFQTKDVQELAPVVNMSPLVAMSLVLPLFHPSATQSCVDILLLDTAETALPVDFSIQALTPILQFTTKTDG